MKKVTLRIPPLNADYNGIHLTFVIYVEQIEDLNEKIVEMFQANMDPEGAIRIDLSYGLITGRLFISDRWDLEASLVSVEEVDDLGEF